MDVLLMWKELETMALGEVASRHGLTKQRLVALFDQAGLTGRREADPGPDEIASAALAIRMTWSPQVERSRWIAARRMHGVI